MTSTDHTAADQPTSDPTTNGYGIGEVADRFGLDPDTVRYYERHGVLPRPARNVSGRRVYDDDAIHLIAVLLHLKATGMPLAQIAEFTGHVARDPAAVPERLALLRAHRVEVDQRIAAWTASLRIIDQKIADYQARHDGTETQEPRPPAAAGGT